MDGSDSDVVEVAQSAGRWTIATWALIAFVATPLVLTGLYRVTPDDVPAWALWPIAAVGLAALAFGWWRPRWRAVTGAVLASEALWLVFVSWLFTSLVVLE